jgi:DNA-binding MarR family transcriptional regulator
VDLGPDEAEAWRHRNIGRLLLFAFRAFEARLLADYRAAGFDDVRQVHLNALRHIDADRGTRIVELARRAGVTKGAMGQLVEDARRLGLVRLSADPDDARAKIVRFSARGRRLMTVTQRAAHEAELDFARIVGADEFERLRATLERFRDASDAPRS